MGKKDQNIQDVFLNHLRKERIQVTLYLINGARLKGTINGFDNFVVILRQGVNQLIYKHAISTITPDKDIRLKEGE